MHDLTSAPRPASAPPDLTPSLRYRGGQEHHLWQKCGIWFVRYSVVSGGAGKAHRRVCRSLGTRDRLIARRRRDELLAQLPARPAVVPRNTIRS
jgi:hypothetical protein